MPTSIASPASTKSPAPPRPPGAVTPAGPAGAGPSDSDTLAASFATSYAGVVAFLAVADAGSFAKAGDRLGIGRSAVSRAVQKLEAQLDARLFLRTTRSTALTPEGERFYANSRPGVDRIMQALDDMRDLREGPPQGHLRICSAVGFGRKVVAPLIAAFQDTYPAITIDLVLDDSATDFTTDRVDIAFRDGRMEDSQVIARQLIPMQMLLCATPAYLQAHGAPGAVDDLDVQRCINLRLASGRVYDWEFKVDGHARKYSPQAACTFNDLDLLRQAVLDGRGLAQMPCYQVCDDLRAGRLVSVLGQHMPDDRGHYLCYLSRKHLPARMRVFIDFMTHHIRQQDLFQP
ncbi:MULTISPECIES: LysR family transcriptional regulator [unclassified Achromobacter]|uniref:LysR family transcriptional regulator n=1 Tax=unclassified Achromobacter TaxID=2626865 RepID=UPI000B51E04F|nr:MULTISPECIES: LysR family transcriptional regulator [unclassified Achromobacter]OWT73529.1 LysR family transcriptional regulator [Achromobacter sp. HZ34]OWT79553.1 LysR family transcriptional regulator [Achromobacter sp. HZ28]